MHCIYSLYFNPPCYFPILVFYRMPVYCIPVSAGQHWRADGISEASYDAETRSISFKMDAFYAFTLLQESYSNMPFQSWELKPLGQDSAVFTITGALIEVSITVKARDAPSKKYTSVKSSLKHRNLGLFWIHVGFISRFWKLYFIYTQFFYGKCYKYNELLNDYQKCHTIWHFTK